MSRYPSPLWRVVAITYEQNAKGEWIAVVRHEFYGATPEQATGVFHAHVKQDAFLRACQQGSFNGIPCHTTLAAPERCNP